MIKSLTICYVTGRKEPQFKWFWESLARECTSDNVSVIVVDSQAPSIEVAEGWKQIHDHGRFPDKFTRTAPKPTIWQGAYRITKEDWWAKSNAMNTGIILCQTEWIAFVDDRSVLIPGWLHAIQDAMMNEYAVCGTYEKREYLVVENGELLDWGNLLGVDDRPAYPSPRPLRDWYGGSCALPLEWCLQVNGYPEDYCDGLGFEDVAFGILLRNNNFPMYFDARMKIVEDRTPTEIDGALKRASKPSPTDNIRDAKDYKILDIMNASRVSGNSYDIREVRDRVLKGEPFPPPSQDHRDWFDGQPISEIT